MEKCDVIFNGPKLLLLELASALFTMFGKNGASFVSTKKNSYESEEKSILFPISDVVKKWRHKFNP